MQMKDIPDDVDHTLSKVIRRWGKGAQIAKLHEEIGELMAAIGHVRCGRATADAIAEEIADVNIMLRQLTLMFDLVGPVARYEEQKLERLRERLADDQWSPNVTPELR